MRVPTEFNDKHGFPTFCNGFLVSKLVPGARCFPLCDWAWRPVVGVRTTKGLGARWDGNQFGNLRFGWLNETVISAHPISFELDRRGCNGLAVFTPVILQSGAVAQFGFSFARGKGARSPGVGNVTTLGG